MKLPLVHLDDVVEGLLAAGARSDVGGSIVHLVDSTPVTQRDYIAWSREHASRAIRAHYVPRPALLLAGAVLDLVGGMFGRTLGLSRYRIRSIKELTFDCSAARNRLGWEPRHRFPSRSSRGLDRPASAPVALAD